MMHEETQYGFKWGYIEVERTASNDGSDKRKKYQVLTVKHKAGHIIEIVITKEGVETNVKKRI